MGFEHGTARHGTAQHITTHRSTPQHSTTYSIAQHITAQHSTTQPLRPPKRASLPPSLPPSHLVISLLVWWRLGRVCLFFFFRFFFLVAASSITANRLAYVFGLVGPSMMIDTACSSSLVATDAACKAMYAHDCEVAVAVGVNLLFNFEVFISFCAAGMLSRKG